MHSLLIVKTSSMGDVIQYLPAVTDLRTHFPHLEIDWAVEAPFAPLARLHPAVRQVIPIALRTWRKRLGARQTWRDFGALRRRLREARYDKVLDAQGLIKSACIARMARAPVVGYGPDSAREPLATRLYAERHSVSWQLHAVERNRRLTAAAMGYRLDTPLRYGVRAPAPGPNNALPGGPYALLFSATARDEKLWPEPNWVELGRALNRKGLQCVLTAGTPRERERAERIAEQVSHAVVAPPMPLDALSTLIAHAHCAVGVDTGLSHLAAALEVPIVALYLATDPAANGVAGGLSAINLGNKGACPSVAQVLRVLHPWLE